MIFLARMASGLGSGLLFGWIFGVLEALGLIAVHLIGTWHRTGHRPPFGLVDLAAIPLMAGVLYALVFAGLSLLITPLAAPLLNRLPGGLAPEGRRESARVTSITLILFFGIYWWSRPWVFYGQRFHHPGRLAASVGLAILALILALLIVRWVRRLGAGTERRRRLLVGLAIPVIGATILLSLRERAATGGEFPASGTKVPPNVVLIVPDALRADHLGCYGYDPYDRPVSPAMDRFAEEATLFTRAITQAPYTWTSFGSFLTGKFPRKHGLLKMDPTQRLDPQDNVTLAELLDDRGYTCGAFLMGTLSNNSGLLQGFDVYFEALVGHDPVNVHSKWSIFKSDLSLMRIYNKIRQARDPALVNTLAMDFIRDQRDRPFFLMVHYYATHTPYDPPEPYKSLYDPDYDGVYDTFTQSHHFAVMDGRLEVTPRDLKRITALYDGGVTFTDDMVGDLLAALDETGVADRTLVILTSDHGEELYDHRLFEHDWMYDTNQHVPLIVRFPDGAHRGRRVTEPVSLIDLVPTVAEVVDFDLPEAVAAEMDGRSLLRRLDGSGGGPRYTYCENNRYLSVQDREFKLIRYRWPDRDEPDRLFHIAEDPGETKNVIHEHPEVFARLDAAWKAHDESMPENLKTYASDPDLMKRLSELGYLQGNVGFEGDLERRGAEEKGTGKDGSPESRGDR